MPLRPHFSHSSRLTAFEGFEKQKRDRSWEALVALRLSWPVAHFISIRPFPLGFDLNAKSATAPFYGSVRGLGRVMGSQSIEELDRGFLISAFDPSARVWATYLLGAAVQGGFPR